MLGKLFATLGKEYFTLKDVGHIFHPRIQKEIQALVVKSNGLYVLPMSRFDTNFRVSEIPRPLQGYDPTSYRVNLEEKWCDYGYFQALKSPCQHAIAACSNSRRDYKNSVDPVYFLHSVCKVYEMEFPAIENLLVHPKSDILDQRLRTNQISLRFHVSNVIKVFGSLIVSCT
ncbi:hypothetical protein V6N11_010451 [Hibiscus sabdariffa]|uniref:SWIM-type domain-containing protein n=1 Tax=Hibiscus sabdariffa TaxID=183260 RepID=A0ABR2S5C1_9ROSI